MDRIQNEKCDVVGFMDERYIYDDCHCLMGQMDDSRVLDIHSQVLARIDGNFVRDHLNRTVAWLDSDSVLDMESFKVISRVTAISRKMACAAAFFAFFK